MNVSIPFRKFILYLAVLLLPTIVSSQIEYHEVLMNDSLTYHIESVGNPAQIDVPPTNGDYIFNGLSNYPLGQAGDNELIYIPNANFTGSDTIKILYYALGQVGPTQAYVTLVIDVVETFVVAVNDYAATFPNVSITVDVLENDLGSGDLRLADIPLANHGTAVVINNAIDFTPYPGFAGITNLTYTVCDEVSDICDVATITVFVQENLTYIDTTLVATLKNQVARALFSTSNGIQELTSPQHGTLSLIDGGVSYTPDVDFVGLDTFTYAYNINSNTSLHTFIIDVLWAPDPSNFVVTDYGYVAIGDSTELNVLDNDQNEDLAILTFTQSDEGGQVINNGNGLFKYIPPVGFEGLDFFEYTAVIPGTSAQETGICYFVVSNQKPSSEAYDLSTPKNTPLVINYDIPIANFDFAIINQGQFGEVIYYPGETTIQVYGQEVSGYNLLIYTPYDSYVGTDAFDIEYCVGTDCKDVAIDIDIQEILNPQTDTLCITDCVWPGDANGDGSVNMTDILPLGYCVGEVGSDRINGSTNWYGQYSADWNGMIGSTGRNIKHADANGDGYISALDTAAISLSYGRTNHIAPESEPTNTQIPLFFVPQTPNPAPGDKVIIDIVLGTENLPAIDVHGITFALNFNPDIVEPGTMTVEYKNNNWLSYESAMIGMMKEPVTGRVESGYTRATGVSNHGYGIIGQVSFIVVEEIIDGARLKDTLSRPFRPESMMSMNAAGQYIALDSKDFEIRVAHEIAEQFDDDNRNLIAYPNPTTGYLNIHVNGNNELEQVIVHSITGQEVFRTHDELSGKQTSITFDDKPVANGIYLITAICDKGVYTKKVELIR